MTASQLHTLLQAARDTLADLEDQASWGQCAPAAAAELRAAIVAAEKDAEPPF